MKALNFKKGASSLLLLAALATPAYQALAQEDMLLNETDQILNSDQIDIDGIYNQKPKPSAADRMAKMRKQLEQKTNEMVDKKIEVERVKAEAELTKKLQDAFQRGFNAMDGDTVTTSQASVARVQTNAPEAQADRKSKITLSTGMNAITGNSIDVESNLGVNLNAETMVHSNISVGLGLGYLKMDATDIGRSSYYYGQEVNYSRLTIEANSKFFMSTEGAFRPYAGVALGYNRSSLKYSNANSIYGANGYYNSNNYYNYNPYYYNSYNTYSTQPLYNYQDGFSSSYLSGSVALGSDVVLADRFGINLEVKYTKAITSGYDKNLGSQGLSNDEGDLRNITRQIEDADQISINAGVSFRF